MKLMFGLVLMAVCLAVCSAQSCTVDTFNEDTSWKDTDGGKPEDFPEKNAQTALEEDGQNARLLASRKADKSLQPPELERASAVGERTARALAPWHCPFRYRYIWYYKNCWIIWPKLRYARCQKKSCQHCSGHGGRCRPDCFFTYKYILGVCQKQSGWWVLSWLPPITLPQYCDCRRC